MRELPEMDGETLRVLADAQTIDEIPQHIVAEYWRVKKYADRITARILPDQLALIVAYADRAKEAEGKPAKIQTIDGVVDGVYYGKGPGGRAKVSVNGETKHVDRKMVQVDG